MTKSVNKSVKTATAKAKAPAKATAPAKAKAPAKLTAAQADLIVSSKGGANSTSHHVHSAGGDTLSFPSDRWSGELRAACAVGQSFKAAEALWAKLAKAAPAAKLATGISGRDAPHASKAIADSKAKAAPAAKATAPASKAAPAAKAPAPAKGADRTYKALANLADLGLREGTWTIYMVGLALKHTSTAKADAELAKKPFDAKARKLDWTWMAAKKFIAFA
jgi:hypothetical protein